MNLIFYGTLRDHDVLRLVAGDDILDKKYREIELPDYKLLYVKSQYYPVMIAAPGFQTPCSLYRGISESEFSSLKHFEGDEYGLNSIELEGVEYLFFAPSPKVSVSDKLWTLEEFQQIHKTNYLKQIPEWMK